MIICLMVTPMKNQLQVNPDSELPSRIGLLALDFDGVLTNNKVIFSEDGTESVVCDKSDSLGLAAIKNIGMPIIVISTETNPVVGARCNKLGVECLQGTANKLVTLTALAREREIPLSSIVFVGNDVNDLECLKKVGCGVVVADAHPETFESAKIVLTKNGGEGAVRQLCDIILKHVSKTEAAKYRSI